MTDAVLVTGATGNVGAAAVRALQEAGIPVRAAGTDPAALARRHPGLATARLNLRDPATFAPALDGVGGLFLVRPPAMADVGRTLGALLDVAEQRGVGHVVFSSVAGADTNRLLPHHRVESRLRASTLSWTILRPGFFAQNLADAYRRDICRDHRIFVPAGQGRAAFLDVRDIGEAAAVVFTEPAAHRGAGYLLTGPRAVSFTEVAAILTAELAERITYEPATVPGYLRHLHRQGLPLTQVLVQTVLHAGLRRGQAEVVDRTLPRLLGRPARSLEEYVHDHRGVWMTASGAAG